MLAADFLYHSDIRCLVGVLRAYRDHASCGLEYRGLRGSAPSFILG